MADNNVVEQVVEGNLELEDQIVSKMHPEVLQKLRSVHFFEHWIMQGMGDPSKVIDILGEMRGAANDATQQVRQMPSAANDD